MATFLTFFHPTFYPVFLPPPFQVFLEAESVVVAEPAVFSPVVEPEVFVLVFAVAELSPEVVVLAAEPEVVSVAAELSPGAVVLAVEPEVVSVVAEPEVVFGVDFEVSEPGVVSVAVVSVADAAEPQASVDIVVAFAVLVLVSVVVAEVDSPGCSKFFVFPNIYSFPNCSNSVEAFGEESAHSSTDAHTNHDLCSILSNLGLYQNKNLEHCYNNPSPCYNNVSDTNDLPKNATTNHSRNICLHQCQGQHRHTSQVSLSPRVVRQKRWAAAEEN